MKVKRLPNDIIEKTVDKMNSLPTGKYGIAPNEMVYREWLDISLGKVSQSQCSYERHEKSKYKKKKKKSLEFR